MSALPLFETLPAEVSQGPDERCIHRLGSFEIYVVPRDVADFQYLRGLNWARNQTELGWQVVERPEAFIAYAPAIFGEGEQGRDAAIQAGVDGNFLPQIAEPRPLAIEETVSEVQRFNDIYKATGITYAISETAVMIGAPIEKGYGCLTITRAIRCMKIAGARNWVDAKLPDTNVDGVVRCLMIAFDAYYHRHAAAAATNAFEDALTYTSDEYGNFIEVAGVSATR
jgi:hypothetical protein